MRKDHEILNYMTTVVSSGFSACAVEYPNTQIDTDSLDEWVRMSVRPGPPILHSLSRDVGTRLIEYRGFLYFQVFTKPDQGVGRLHEISQLLNDLFELRTLNNIEFSVAQTQYIGNAVSDKISTTETPWFQMTTSIFYKALT